MPGLHKLHSPFLSLMSSAQWNLKDRWTMCWTISLFYLSFLPPPPHDHNQLLKEAHGKGLLSSRMIHWEWRKASTKKNTENFPVKTMKISQSDMTSVPLSKKRGPPFFPEGWKKEVHGMFRKITFKFHISVVDFSLEFIIEAGRKVWNNDPTAHKLLGIFC